MGGEGKGLVSSMRIKAGQFFFSLSPAVSYNN